MFNRARLSDDIVFIAVVCLIGLCIRLHLLFVANFVVDADEAIVGLMAKHILEGKGVPVFYYGQHYMGSFEAICAALLFGIFGISGVALKAVPLLFSILLLPILYLLCIEIAGRGTARLATLFMAVPPMGLVEWSGKARGGFIEILVLGALALLFGIRFFRTSSRSAESRFYFIGTALLLGFGWWINNQIVYFMVPVSLLVLGWCFLHPSLKVFGKVVAVGTASFFVGGAPYWVYNASHNFISFEMFHSAGSKNLLKHLVGLFTSALPILFGAKRFWHDDEVFIGSTAAAYILYGAVLLVFFVQLYRRKGEAHAIWFWTLFPITFFMGVAIFTTSVFGSLVQAPRYLLPLYVVLMPFCAYVICELFPPKNSLKVFFAAGILALNLSSTYLGGLSVPGEPLVYHGERVQRDHGELLSWLRDNNITFVRTNYWIGYKLAFESREAVRFSMFQEPYQIRMTEYEVAAKKASDELSLPIVAVPAQAALLRKGLAHLHIPYKEAAVSGYIVFHSIEAPDRREFKKIPVDAFTVATNTNPEALEKAVDDSMETRWGTGSPQRPGMEVSIALKEATEVRGLKTELGTFATDYPRSLQIEYEGEDGVREVLFKDYEMLSVLYFLHESSAVDIILPPKKYRKLYLVQTGKDPVFDWSIAELELFVH